MGDPCGIGPEVVIKALSLQEIRNIANYTIIGSERVFHDLANNLGLTLPESINYHGIDNVLLQDVSYHKPTTAGGRASVECVLEGVRLSMEGRIDALVTAPISKEAVKLAGFEYTGHTEFLRDKTASGNVVMLMVGKELKVSFVTTHLALKDVPHFIIQESVFSTIETTAAGLKQYFNIDKPRIAVCGLNPHCGDGNRFGSEESDFIIPAIKQAQEIGIDCTGPISADIIFNKAIIGDFDAVVAHYHDQGAIPIKLHAFDTGVNITLGIPIIRTSPTHGTAFDIAGKDIANPNSMVEAIKTAVTMAELDRVYESHEHPACPV